MNRTMTLRRDSDVVARHGLIELRDIPLTSEELARTYSNNHLLQQDLKINKAPVVWFVSHCNDFNGRQVLIHHSVG